MSAPTLERSGYEDLERPVPAVDPFHTASGARGSRRDPARGLPWRPAQHQRARPARAVEAPLARVAVAALLLVVAVVYLANIAGWPAFFDDEGTYVSQAWALQELGTLAPYTYWYDHPPVGWMQLAALTWLPDLVLGTSELVAGRIVTVGFVLATAVLLYMLGRRVGLARGWALAAVAVWALNPLTLYWGRQVLLDNVSLPWLVGAFVLAVNRRNHLGKHMLAGLCFGIAVLTKETNLVFAPALVVALWQAAHRPTRTFALTGFAVLTALTGAMYLAYAAIRQELLPGDDHVSVAAAIDFQLNSREGSGFILDPTGDEGSSWWTLTGWLDLDPYLLVGGLAASVLALAVRRLRPVALVVVLATVVALRPDGYLPGMYVVAVLPFCALALVGLLDVLWRRLRTARSSGADRTGWAAVPAHGVVVVAAALSLLPAGEQVERWRTAVTEDATAVHDEAVARVAADVPEDAVVVVDNTYWNDLVEAGRDTDDVVWFYKVDSDPEVSSMLGGTYEGIDYLLWSKESMSDLAPVVKQAYDNSDLVWSVGEGDELVELREVVTQAQQRSRESVARQDFALEMRALQLELAAPSSYPGLSNGQVAAIADEASRRPAPEVAAEFGTTAATVTAILEEQR